jgi:glucokinase
MAIIAIDIGGTRTRVAWCDITTDTHENPSIEATPRAYKDGLNFLRLEIERVAAGRRPEAIIVGMPGIIDTARGLLERSPHLPGWVGANLSEDLKDMTPRVIVRNDAALVGLGEAVYGAGKGFDIVSYLTVSTGIGGARIVAGKLDPAFEGFEPGFQIIDVAKGATLEDIASGSAIEARFGRHPRDVAKTPAWKEVEHAIAVGIHNTVLHWSPNVVVVGGSMANDLSALRLSTELSKIMRVHARLPQVRLATLGAVGGIFGAIALAKTL